MFFGRHNFFDAFQVLKGGENPGGGGGGTPLYGLYGDVPLDRVWFLASSVLNRVYNFMRTCPKQGMFF